MPARAKPRVHPSPVKDDTANACAPLQTPQLVTGILSTLISGDQPLNPFDDPIGLADNLATVGSVQSRAGLGDLDKRTRCAELYRRSRSSTGNPSQPPTASSDRRRTTIALALTSTTCSLAK
jgi:hypothetical protein